MSTDSDIAKDRIDAVYEDINGCIEYIEILISKKWSYSEITKGLEILYGRSYDSFRVCFGKYMPIGLNTYVKRRILTRGYLQAQIEQPHLTRRSEYYGLRAFVEKFEREFHKSFYGQYTEDELQPEYLFSREST